MMKERLAYSVGELKDVVGFGPTKVYEEIRAGRLRAKKFGTNTIILAEDLKRYLEGLPDYVSEGKKKQ